MMILNPNLSYKNPQHGPIMHDIKDPITAPIDRSLVSLLFFRPKGKYVIVIVLVSNVVKRNIMKIRKVREEHMAAFTFL